MRYQRERPGELVHIDTQEPLQDRRHRPGYLHVAADDASRLAYTETLPDEHKITAQLFRKILQIPSVFYALTG